MDESVPFGKTGQVPKGFFRQEQKSKEKPMFKMFSTMTVCGLLTISAAYAQSDQPIQAKVPFPFMAQDTALAPGTYQLTYNTSAHRLKILGLDQNSESSFATAVPATASTSRDDSAKLVFQCYGKACYLAQVWQGSIGAGRGLQVPHPEPPRKLTLATRVVSITIPAK